jgi:hypothetical protein
LNKSPDNQVAQQLLLRLYATRGDYGELQKRGSVLDEIALSFAQKDPAAAIECCAKTSDDDSAKPAAARWQELLSTATG